MYKRRNTKGIVYMYKRNTKGIRTKNHKRRSLKFRFWWEEKFFLSLFFTNNSFEASFQTRALSFWLGKVFHTKFCPFDFEKYFMQYSTSRPVKKAMRNSLVRFGKRSPYMVDSAAEFSPDARLERFLERAAEYRAAAEDNNYWLDRRGRLIYWANDSIEAHFHT